VPDTARVLVLSIDATLADLVKLNLERRRFGVRQQTWAACCGAGAATSEEADLVVADLDCPPPACWNGLSRLRALFPSHPLLVLAYDRPTAPFLQGCSPCRYLQKPFAIDNFMQAVGSLISPRT